MAETANIQTLHDHTTGDAIAPRTVVAAMSGTGTKGQLVGFTEDDVVGLIDPDEAITTEEIESVWTEVFTEVSA